VGYLADVSVRAAILGDTAFTVDSARNFARDQRSGDAPCRHRPTSAGELLGVVETVPTIRSLMVSYDPLPTSRAARAEIDALIARGLPTGAASRHVSIRVATTTPDSTDLAEWPGAPETTEQVIAKPSPRRSGLCWVSCRARLCRASIVAVPAAARSRGSRATLVGGDHHGQPSIRSSPGGWRLVSRTPLWMFDQRREQGLPGAGRLAFPSSASTARP
jgi:allophanate hydrolase subunit 1